jgi:hypothetical protein
MFSLSEKSINDNDSHIQSVRVSREGPPVDHMPYESMQVYDEWHKIISLTIWAATYSKLIWQLYNVDKNRGTPFGSDETPPDCVSQYSCTSLSDTKQYFTLHTQVFVKNL